MKLVYSLLILYCHQYLLFDFNEIGLYDLERRNKYIST